MGKVVDHVKVLMVKAVDIGATLDFEVDNVGQRYQSFLRFSWLGCGPNGLWPRCHGSNKSNQIA